VNDKLCKKLAEEGNHFGAANCYLKGLCFNDIGLLENMFVASSAHCTS